MRGGGDNNRIKLSSAYRERRITAVLSSLIGDDKTTQEISFCLPYEDTIVRNILRNLKSKGYVSTDPPICDHHGYVVWIITPSGVSRARRGMAGGEEEAVA